GLGRASPWAPSTAANTCPPTAPTEPAPNLPGQPPPDHPPPDRTPPRPPPNRPSRTPSTHHQPDRTPPGHRRTDRVGLVGGRGRGPGAEPLAGSRGRSPWGAGRAGAAGARTLPDRVTGKGTAKPPRSFTRHDSYDPRLEHPSLRHQ